MDFTLLPHIEDYRKRYRAFVAEHLLPLEQDPDAYDDHENIRLDVLETMRTLRVRHVPVVEGGRVVGMVSIRDLRNAIASVGGPRRGGALRRLLRAVFGAGR